MSIGHRSLQQDNEAHLRELPELVDRLVVQPKAGLDTICVVSARHVPDLWALLVAKAVAMQVVDVGHVNGILKATPVVACKLNLTCTHATQVRLGHSIRVQLLDSVYAFVM